MKLFKWGILFVFAFISAWVMIFTFTQPPFKEKVPAQLLAYQTPAIPIYTYVAGAFAVGLLVGLIIAFYYYILMRSEIHKKSKRLKELEKEIAGANDEIAYKSEELSRLKAIIQENIEQQKRDKPPMLPPKDSQ